MKREVAAELRMDGARLSCVGPQGQERWSIQVGELVLVAEYTTNEGPWLDDYFLIFWTREDGKLLASQAPLGANGGIVIGQLSELLGVQLHLGLVDNTEWKSRVIWPHQLEDEEYFTFTPAKSEGWLRSTWERLIGTQEYRPSEKVVRFLHQADS